jgi:hypothetical protein
MHFSCYIHDKHTHARTHMSTVESSSFFPPIQFEFVSILFFCLPRINFLKTIVKRLVTMTDELTA